MHKDSLAEMLNALSEARRFNRWIADTIRPYMGECALELGAGMGNLSRFLAPDRRRYVATDINAEYLGILQARLGHQSNLAVCICDLMNPEHLAAFREQMDTVVCLNVLEHTEDDLSALRNLRTSLKRGGKAIILVPQGASNFGTLDRALGHFRRYSAAELEQKMRTAGFRVERILPFNRITYPGWFLNGRILRRSSVGGFQLGVFDRLTPLWRRIDRFLPWPPVSLIAIGALDETPAVLPD